MSFKPFHLEEIRAFFAKRTWCRPDDYEAVEACEIGKRRAQELSVWMHGYLCGRGGDHGLLSDRTITPPRSAGDVPSNLKPKTENL